MSLTSPAPDPTTSRAIAQRAVGTLPQLVRQLQGRAKADSFDRGTGQITWPGGSPVSSQVTIAHGLRSAPSSVQLTALGFANANAHLQVDAVDATSIRVRGRTIDGSSPAAATPCPFMWEARI